MPDSSPISVRAYRPGDEQALVELFRRVFGRAITEDHWRWKLKGQPATVDNVWLAVSEDRPVFQYAGIPTRFRLLQATVTSMVSVDTMTAPEFRRRGLLTQVAGQAYAAWRESGIAFVIGLPNNQWGSRTGALGWQPLAPLQWMMRPLRPEAFLARRLNLPVLKRATLAAAVANRFLQARLRRDREVQTERVRNADESFDQIWERCKSDWSFSTVRDRNWVNWRFLSSPSRTYELTLARRAGQPVGYCVHSLIESKERTIAYLAEVLVARADDATRDTLLWELIETLLATHVEALSTLAVPGTPWFRCLRRIGFIPRHTFSVELVPLSTQLPMDLLLDPNRWNLTGADFDVV